MTNRERAEQVTHRLSQAGHEAVWAGGCVRDMLMGVEPTDYDIATDATPERIAALFPHTVPVGAAFGVVRVLWEGGCFEVATFRSDQSYTDGRHPDRVTFSNARDDVLRRDFTINAMLYDPVHDRVLDWVGGRRDIEARLIRAVGDPVQRFGEDRLRMLRAVRFAARLGFGIEPETEHAIRHLAPHVVVVSPERIREELEKILVHPSRASAMATAFRLDLVAALLPELVPMKGLPQDKACQPGGDLWDHSLSVLEHIEDPSFALALAALLHDVGKPSSMGRRPGSDDPAHPTPRRLTFHRHERIGKEMARRICRRLRLSNADTHRVVWLVHRHMYLMDAKLMRLSKLKQTFAEPGLEDLLALHEADALASGGDASAVAYCRQLLATLGQDEISPPALLTGHDLVRHGLEPGPAFRVLLDRVREAQLDKQVHTRKQALELVDRLVETMDHA